MLGLFGALAFGIVYYGAWLSADNIERKAREDSMINNYKYYNDKHGYLRYTSNGKKIKNNDNIMLIASYWRMYNNYIEICDKYNMKSNNLEEWLRKRYLDNEWESIYNKMMKYKNESWGDKYDRSR